MVSISAILPFSRKESQMKKTFLSILAFAALFIGLQAVSAIAAEDAPKERKVWTLEGKTLDDFDCWLMDNGKKEDVFRIEDGILKVSGTPFGWLSPKDEEFRNFILTADVRYPTDNDKANSGFFLRIVETPDRPEPLFLPPCIECQLQTKNIGHLFGFHGHTLIGAEDRYSYRARIEKDGKFIPELHKLMNFQDAQKPGTEEWNRVVVICYEDAVSVFVNEKPVNWACRVSNVAGKIGFQSEGGEIWFRNVKIGELD